MARFDTKDRMIDDFGVQLSGARKETFDIDAIESMTMHELEVKVLKRVLWPEPDWKVLFESNAHYSAPFLYYCRIIRDKLKARPNVKGLKDETELRARCMEYATVVLRLKKACETGFKAWDRGSIHNAIQFLAQEAKEPKLQQNLRNIGLLEQAKMTDACLLQDFPNKMVARLKFAYLQEHSQVGANGQREAYYTISKKTRKGDSVSIISEKFANKQDAFRYARQNIQKKGYQRKPMDMSKMVYLMRPELESIDRIGPNIRNNINVLDLDMLSEFNIAGGEFGVWNSQKDRQAVLNYTYDALCDLAYILNVPHKMIGLESSAGAKISISYGARGSGWQEKAKYLKDANNNEIIHIQKLNGAGWLARAYGHAVDNYIGSLYNGKGLKEPMSWYVLNKHNTAVGNAKVLSAFDNLIKAMSTTRYLAKLRRYGDAVLSKAFALCFEAYIEDTLAQHNMRNDYLVSGTTTSKQRVASLEFAALFPQHDARKKINAKMAELLDVVFHELSTENAKADESESAMYTDTDGFVQYTDNIVSEDDLSEITDSEALNSRLNFKSRLQRLGNIDPTYRASAKDLDAAYDWWLKKMATNLDVKLVLADTRQFIEHYKAPYFVTKGNTALVLNLSADAKTKLQSAITGAIDIKLANAGTNLGSTVTDAVIKEAAAYYLCGLAGVDLGEKYCSSEIYTAISKDSVMTGRLLDEINSITKELLVNKAA